MLLKTPLLIKRPLIVYQGQNILGYDLGRLCTLIPSLGRFSPVDPGTCSSSDSCN